MTDKTTPSTDPMTIADAESVARERGWGVIVVYGALGESQTLTTWGHAGYEKVAAAEIGDQLKETLKWDPATAVVHADFRLDEVAMTPTARVYPERPREEPTMPVTPPSGYKPLWHIRIDEGDGHMGFSASVTGWTVNDAIHRALASDSGRITFGDDTPDGWMHFTVGFGAHARAGIARDDRFARNFSTPPREESTMPVTPPNEPCGYDATRMSSLIIERDRLHATLAETDAEIDRLNAFTAWEPEPLPEAAAGAGWATEVGRVAPADLVGVEAADMEGVKAPLPDVSIGDSIYGVNENGEPLAFVVDWIDPDGDVYWGDPMARHTSHSRSLEASEVLHVHYFDPESLGTMPRWLIEVRPLVDIGAHSVIVRGIDASSAVRAFHGGYVDVVMSAAEPDDSQTFVISGGNNRFGGLVQPVTL